MGLSKFITRRDPQKIGEMRDMGINLNDFAPAREPRDSLFSGITKAVRRATPVEQTPFIGRDFSMFDQAKMGQAPILPGYDEEMDIDDTGRINFADYLKQFGDTAQGGLTELRDQGMSLFDDSRRSGLIRAGLGSMLFGFNPLTAILGAVIGQKGPGIFSSLKGRNINPLDFIKEKRAEREAAKAAEVARIARQNLAESLGSDSGPGEGAGTFGASVNEATGARGSGTGFSDYS